jgi:predicted transcriptional regulator
MLALEKIAEGPVGRSRLANSLKVGDGAIRTIIGRLLDAGLIETSKSGCALTRKGENLWKEYQAAIRKAKIERNELTDADFSFAVLVRNKGHRLRSGMEQRDAAVRAGAKSATTIVLKKGHLTIPSVSDGIDKDFPKSASQITRLLKPEENDIVIVSSADTPEKAEYGVLAAAWTLLGDS